MPDLGSMIDGAIAALSGQTADVPAQGTLLESVDETAGSLKVDFGSNPGAARPNGLIEVDSELLAITQFDPASGTAIVPAWGRGQRGTAPAAHDAGARVTVRPRFPRGVVGRAINDQIAGLSPALFAVRDLDPIVINTIPPVAYPLPADTLKVLRVEAEVAGSYPWRYLLRNWRINTKASGQELELSYRWLQPYANQTLTVTIAANPGRLAAESDDYETVTGLPLTTADIPVLGAQARLILSAEAARTQLATVEAATRLEKIQPGSATGVAKAFLALYQQRLASEVASLQARFPLTLRRS